MLLLRDKRGGLLNAFQLPKPAPLPVPPLRMLSTLRPAVWLSPKGISKLGGGNPPGGIVLANLGFFAFPLPLAFDARPAVQPVGQSQYRCRSGSASKRFHSTNPPRLSALAETQSRLRSFRVSAIAPAANSTAKTIKATVTIMISPPPQWRYQVRSRARQSTVIRESPAVSPERSVNCRLFLS